ncbi:Fc receptor-like protein 4 [Xenopus laevis]|uniref:Fc receptor-like protein 4 n=1 Tax=Xenopus laevis TaxID=8355 RepID=A0A8J1LMG6_XENLA|nr:Fc receptor-like protein 4 [Xenopus laevis]
MRVVHTDAQKELVTKWISSLMKNSFLSQYHCEILSIKNVCEWNSCAILVSTEDSLTPLISLSPQWATILTDDFVILTCNEASAAEGTWTYSWYKDGDWISGDEQSLEMKNAEVRDSGNYQCQIGASQRSDPVGLDVRNDFVILQAPSSVYEGDSLSLNCYSLPGYNGRNTVFYKDNNVFKTQPSDSYLHIGRVNVNTSGTYRCEKEVNYYHYFYHSYGFYTHSAKVIISVSELFPVPQIKVSSDQVTKGDHMTITCDTKLSPHRETTELQFVFYRNGHNVQGFSLSNQYGVPSAQLEDSGNYTCEVQTSSRSIKKKSGVVVIQIQELFSTPQIIVDPYPWTEGDHMTITCDTKLSPHRETTELQFVFYRNGHNVQGFSLSNQYGVPSAQLEDSGNYTCEVQTPTGSVRKRSNVMTIGIQELFLNPLIKVSPDQVTEGDHMTITCDTKLSPHRETTELQFVFYRNGHNVQGFNSSNQYGVPSAQLEDSGNYTCEVQTPTGSVRKRSNVAHFWILERRQKHLIPVLIGILVGVLVISAAIIIFKFRHKILSLLMSQHLEPKTGINVCRTADRTLQRSENKDNSELDDYQPVNNIGGRNPSLTEDSTYVNIKHVWKPTRTLLPKQDKYLVTYAVVRRSSRGIEIQEPSGQESLESSCIYENFKATSFQVDSSHF